MNFLIPAAPAALRGVPCCEFEHGVLVEDADLEAALAALNAEMAEEKATAWAGIIELRLRPRANGAAQPPVPPIIEIVDHSGGSRRWTRTGETIAARLRELSVSARLFLYAASDQGAPMAPVDGGQVQILLGSARTWDAHSGPDFFQEKEARLTADFAPGQRYVRVWGLDQGYPDENADSALRLIERLLPILCECDPQKVVEWRAARDAEIRRRSREAYVNECSRRFDKTVTGTKDAIERGHADVRRLQEELVRRIRETTGAERKLVQLEASRPSATDGYGKEFDKLLAVPKIRDVQIADGVVKVFTDVLFCTDPRTKVKHEIGAFRIEIFTNGGDVRWYNLTRKVRGYERWGECNAPHVNSRGEACLGTMAEIIPELVGNYEFAALAMVAIQFVESVNTADDAGKHIDKWPLAE